MSKDSAEIKYQKLLYREKKREKKRRERIATAALQGIISVCRIDVDADDLAINALRCADALIAELDKEAQQGGNVEK